MDPSALIEVSGLLRSASLNESRGESRARRLASRRWRFAEGDAIPSSVASLACGEVGRTKIMAPARVASFAPELPIERQNLPLQIERYNLNEGRSFPPIEARNSAGWSQSREKRKTCYPPELPEFLGVVSGFPLGSAAPPRPLCNERHKRWRSRRGTHVGGRENVPEGGDVE